MRQALLLFTLGLCGRVWTHPGPPWLLNQRDGGGLSRRRSAPGRLITECVFMTSEEGDYVYRSPMDNDNSMTCGVYVIAEPDQRVIITLDHLDVSCDNGGLVGVVDGWELNGELFPGVLDHPLTPDKRFKEYCGQGSQEPQKRLVSSQNVALVQYRIPGSDEGFRVGVTFVKNPYACSVLLQAAQGWYTLRNHGLRSNCTAAIIYPSWVQMVSVNVGVRKTPTLSPTIRTSSQCTDEEGSSDWLEVVGSNGLDQSRSDVNPIPAFCGLDSNPSHQSFSVACGTTSVRLVSSGQYDNAATVAFEQLDIAEFDFTSADVLCLP